MIENIHTKYLVIFPIINVYKFFHLKMKKKNCTREISFIMIERFFSLKLHVYTLNAHLSTETENRQKFQKINYVIDMS